jgi:probable HAF family extracellular repeat protein
MGRMTRKTTPRTAGKGRSSLIAATVLTLCFSTLISTSPAHAADTVTTQELVAPAGVATSRAQAINVAGVVAGTNLSYTTDAQVSEAYIWSPGTGMTVLGSLGFKSVDVKAITDSGSIVGAGWVPGTCQIFMPFCSDDQHAFRWDELSGVVDLGTLGGDFTFVQSRAAVSESGQVVGTSQTEEGYGHAFLSEPGLPMADLGTLPAHTQSEASAINGSGVVAGASHGANESHAVIWTPTPTGMEMTDLGALPGSTYSRAIDINDAGQVAGISNVDNRPHAVLWSPTGSIQDLGTLAGKDSSTVVALSETGQVVGQSESGGGESSAFSWTQATGMVNLGGLSTDSAPTYVYDVSDAGQVVGAAYTSGQVTTSHAFSWTSESGLVDLTPRGLTRSTAYAVNDSGQIVGNTEDTQSTLWTVAPAPSPGSLNTTVSGGEILTTDPSGAGATPETPVQTRITVPAGVGGLISVTPQLPGSSPTGYEFFGSSLALAGPLATAASPYTVTFTVDGSALGGIAPADVQVFRNGTVVGGCTSPTQAIPDPCVVSRGFATGGAGDAQVTVRTSAFSTWDFGKLAYTLKAGLEPVNLPPFVNTTKAGGAVPVRFRLGGNRGLDIFATGFPKSSVMTCSGGPKDEVELTLPLTKSSLVYERLTQQYVYLWKTERTWRGCRDLVLTFRDGSSATAHFVFR